MKGKEHHMEHEGVHPGRKHRAKGGINDDAKDLESKPDRYDNAPKIEDEAEKRKHGGRTRKKRGGEVEKKHVGEVHGEKEKMRADRKPRKNGGRAGSDQSPFSSARSGKDPVGHKTEAME